MKISTEIWKEMPEYEGKYMVSNLGKVRSLSRIVIRGRGGKQILEDKIISTKKKNYESIILYKDKKRKDFLVHRLVATVFIPKVKGKNYINHKDGNKLNNHVDNLEWCNCKENHQHASKNGLLAIGNRNKNSKLTRKKVLEIRKKYKWREYGVPQLAKEYGVSGPTLFNALKGIKSWRYV